MDKLNICRPSISCRATGHIIEIQQMVETLIDKGYAYVTDEGNVYFDVHKYPAYGQLSGRTLDDTVSGERIVVADDKKNPEDFALWKFADPTHIMKWPSPWGMGYPGWHIECSVMWQADLQLLPAQQPRDSRWQEDGQVSGQLRHDGKPL